MNGECEVSADGNRLGFLSDGSFFGEVPFLDDTFSMARTRTVTAITDSRICFITGVSLVNISYI